MGSNDHPIKKQKQKHVNYRHLPPHANNLEELVLLSVCRNFKCIVKHLFISLHNILLNLTIVNTEKDSCKKSSRYCNPVTYGLGFCLMNNTCTAACTGFLVRTRRQYNLIALRSLFTCWHHT